MHKDLNILPPKMRVDRRKKIKIEKPTYGIVLLLLSVAVSFGANSVKTQTLLDTENKLKLLNMEKEELERKLQDTANSFNIEPDFNNESEMKLQDTLYRIKGLIDTGNSWVNILDEISYLTPPSVTVKSIVEESNGSLTMECLTYSLSDLATMEKAFNSEESPFVDVAIVKYTFNGSTLINKENTSIPFTFSIRYEKTPLSNEPSMPNYEQDYMDYENPDMGLPVPEETNEEQPINMENEVTSGMEEGGNSNEN